MTVIDGVEIPDENLEVVLLVKQQWYDYERRYWYETAMSNALSLARWRLQVDTNGMVVTGYDEEGNPENFSITQLEQNIAWAIRTNLGRIFSVQEVERLFPTLWALTYPTIHLRMVLARLSWS